MKKKSIALFVLWTFFIYSFGAFFGWNYPDDSYAKIKAYAILLEAENSKLNKKLKSCKSR